jgi:Arc/MetJ-type ribon-helix-helix transcriptional regulator
MNLSLSAEAEKIIQDRMRTGGFATPEDVVIAGLAALTDRQDLGEFSQSEMDSLLKEGEASGEALDGHTVLRELREFRQKSTGGSPQ